MFNIECLWKCTGSCKASVLKNSELYSEVSRHSASMLASSAGLKGRSLALYRLQLSIASPQEDTQKHATCLQEERHDAHDDRMPLDTRAASTRSFHSSGGSTRHGGGSLQGSLNGMPRSDRRRSSSYGRVRLAE